MSRQVEDRRPLAAPPQLDPGQERGNRLVDPTSPASTICARTSAVKVFVTEPTSKIVDSSSGRDAPERPYARNACPSPSARASASPMTLALVTSGRNVASSADAVASPIWPTACTSRAASRWSLAARARR